MVMEKMPWGEQHFYPYCDRPAGGVLMPYCNACGVEILYCPQCQEPVSRETKKCPNCGFEIIPETSKERTGGGDRKTGKSPEVCASDGSFDRIYRSNHWNISLFGSQVVSGFL